MCYKGEANKKLWVPFYFFFYALTWTDYVKIFSVKKTFFFLSIHVNKIRPKKHKYCKSLENKINVK